MYITWTGFKTNLNWMEGLKRIRVDVFSKLKLYAFLHILFTLKFLVGYFQTLRSSLVRSCESYKLHKDKLIRKQQTNSAPFSKVGNEYERNASRIFFAAINRPLWPLWFTSAIENHMAYVPKRRILCDFNDSRTR